MPTNSFIMISKKPLKSLCLGLDQMHKKIRHTEIKLINISQLPMRFFRKLKNLLF